jgi:hypothetical protein
MAIVYRRFGPVFKGQEPSFLLGLLTLEDVTDTLSESSVNNYHTTPCNIPEERGSHQHRGGSLKSRSVQVKVVQKDKDRDGGGFILRESLV